MRYFVELQVKIEDDSEQCSVLQEVCPTSEFNQFSSPDSTSTTAIIITDIQPTSTSTSVSTSVTTIVSTQPLTLPTTVPLDASLLTTTAPPATTTAPPATTTAPLATTTAPPAGIFTHNSRTFVVENVTEYSEDEESIVNEETISSIPTKINDTPSGQDERRDSGDTTSDTTPVGDDGRTSTTMQSDDDKALKTESQRPFNQHTPPTTSPYPEGARGGQSSISDRPIVEHLSSLSESFSVLMYSVLQVLRNPAMESFVKDLDSKYGNGSGPVVHEFSQDVEYQNLKMK